MLHTTRSPPASDPDTDLDELPERAVAVAIADQVRVSKRRALRDKQYRGPLHQVENIAERFAYGTRPTPNWLPTCVTAPLLTSTSKRSSEAGIVPTRL